MVIADGDLEENNVETVVRWAQEQITARGGEVRKTDRDAADCDHPLMVPRLPLI